MKRPVVILILLLLLVLLPVTLMAQPPAGPLTDNPPDVCQQPENILPNCNFNNGLDGWQSFTEDGSAQFAVLQGGGECHAPLCPAAYIVTEGHFVGGYYRQVPVAKGNTYFANVVWLAFDSLSNDKGIHDATGGIGRRMGIDPFGGTDPRSPNVIWGPDNWRNDCKICDKQEVVAMAQADTITVFVRIEDRWKLKAAEQGFGVPPSKDQFWIDDVGMIQVAGDAAPAPADTPVPPTDTPPPPTDTPVPPADTPTPEPPEETVELAPLVEVAAELTATAAITAEALDLVPESPVATPTIAQLVAAAPPTLTPTMPPPPTSTLERPKATPTRRPRPTAEPEMRILSTGMLGAAGTTICAGSLVLVIMAVVMAGLAWLYRLGWGQVEDDVDADEPDEGEPVEVEIVE